jgi:alpha-L-fucosidase
VHYPDDTLALFHPFETCATMRQGHKWFCSKGGCSKPADFWSAREIWDHYMASVSVGWVSTLNAPPATSGLIAEPLVTAMTTFGDSLRALLRPVTPTAVVYNATLACGADAAPVTLDLGASVPEKTTPLFLNFPT